MSDAIDHADVMLCESGLYYSPQLERQSAVERTSVEPFFVISTQICLRLSCCMQTLSATRTRSLGIAGACLTRTSYATTEPLLELD